jgi:hypothetical protein
MPICRTCGVQYDEAHFNPYECKICADERQYIGWDGQRWTTPAELRNEGHRGVVRQDEAEGPWGVGTEPSFAIGQRALLIPGLGGNVLWDSAVKDLNTKIRAFIDGWNERSHPFVWTKTADQILAKANRPTTSNPRH